MDDRVVRVFDDLGLMAGDVKFPGEIGHSSQRLSLTRRLIHGISLGTLEQNGSPSNPATAAAG